MNQPITLIPLFSELDSILCKLQWADGKATGNTVAAELTFWLKDNFMYSSWQYPSCSSHWPLTFYKTVGDLFLKNLMPSLSLMLMVMRHREAMHLIA